MPELPEVETIRRSLETLILGRYIEEIRLFDYKALTPDESRSLLLDTRAEIVSLRRKGKYLIIDAWDDLLNNGFSFLIHLRMTGRLIVRNIEEIPKYKVGLSLLLSKYKSPDLSNYCCEYSTRHLNKVCRDELFASRERLAKSIFNSVDNTCFSAKNNIEDEQFSDDATEVQDFDLNQDAELLFLDFQDTRRFGGFQILEFMGEKNSKSYQILGVDGISKDFTEEYLITMAKCHPKLNIKAFLLNQSIIAGLGNIYVDETLFRACVHPRHLVAELSDEKIREIARISKEILQESIGFRGCSFRDYVDGLGKKGEFQYKLKVYQREKAPCELCNSTIEKITVAGRGTRFCPNCQK